MDKQIEYKNSEAKHDWFSNHVLTKEQLAQLIQNKIDRAKVYHMNVNKVKSLVGDS